MLIQHALEGESSNCMIKIVLSMSKGMNPRLAQSNTAQSVVPLPMSCSSPRWDNLPSVHQRYPLLGINLECMY